MIEEKFVDQRQVGHTLVTVFASRYFIADLQPPAAKRRKPLTWNKVFISNPQNHRLSLKFFLEIPLEHIDT